MAGVLDILECPVCLSTPKVTPVFQCANNGHVICVNCVGQLNNVCPVCRDKTGFTRCLTAEKLIQHFRNGGGAKSDGVKTEPSSTLAKSINLCPNSVYGCTEVSCTAAHRIECAYRLLHCPYFTCNLKLSGVELLRTHLPKDHTDIRTITFNSNMVFRLCVRDDHWNATTSYKPVLFSAYGYDFFRSVRRENDRKSWHFWIYFSGPPSQASLFAAEIKLLSPAKKPVLTQVEEVVPLERSLSQVVDDYHGMVIQDEVMRRKVVVNEEFYMSVTLTLKH